MAPCVCECPHHTCASTERGGTAVLAAADFFVCIRMPSCVATMCPCVYCWFHWRKPVSHTMVVKSLPTGSSEPCPSLFCGAVTHHTMQCRKRMRKFRIFFHWKVFLRQKSDWYVTREEHSNSIAVSWKWGCLVLCAGLHYCQFIQLFSDYAGISTVEICPAVLIWAFEMASMLFHGECFL